VVPRIVTANCLRCSFAAATVLTASSATLYLLFRSTCGKAPPTRVKLLLRGKTAPFEK
jgi:hypothetical protein